MEKSIDDTDDTNIMPIISITEDRGDASPDTVIQADVEIHKPLLQASTGSTVIPVSGEKQVSTTSINCHPLFTVTFQHSHLFLYPSLTTPLHSKDL